MTQIAQQAFDTRRGQFWFRHRHDTTWHGWYRLPFTTAEYGYLVSDGGALGYGVGAGGTVVQATNKFTAVTLNKPTGQITMNGAALAAGAAVAFRLNNTLINGLDNVIVTPFNNDAYRVDMQAIFDGGCHIRVTNMTGGSLSDAVVLNFAIIKGATS